ncbi:MAG: Gfo/Idh/MocA family oxidoreductase [Acidimicrobiales bacterium]|nr:Gfo/Idh/MocA family oxidoreductase [Acidimicrobiales bacterium]
MKRIAVVGAGAMGRFHIRTMLDLEGVEVGVVADPFPHPELSQFDVPVSIEPLAVASEGWDGVIVASTDETHAELAITALQAGSRVLCEKPLASDLAGAIAVVETEESIGQRRLQIGFMRRYDPVHLDVVEEIKDLDGIDYLRCTHRNTNAEARPPRVVINQSIIHDIHTITWLLGATAAVAASAVPRPGGLDHVLLTLQMESGALASIEFQDRTYAYEVGIEASGPNGMVRSASPYLPATRRLTSEMEPFTDWFGWFTEAYQIQDRAWIESLDQPQATGPSAWDGLEAQLVSEAALASLAEGGSMVSIDRSLRQPSLYS